MPRAVALKTKDDRDMDSAREELFDNYYPQINYIARRLVRRLPANVLIEDLVNAGAVGFMDALEKFDPERGVQFGTYAEFRIKGAMLDELRSMDWLPRSMRRKTAMLKRGLEKANSRAGGPATEEEVASEMGVALEEYRKLKGEAGAVSIVSIEDMGGGVDGGRSPYETIADTGGLDPVERLGFQETLDAVSAAISDLPGKERHVVSLYYYEGLTMREAGEVMGLTESRVSQLHSQAMERLQHRLKKYR